MCKSVSIHLRQQHYIVVKDTDSCLLVCKGKALVRYTPRECHLQWRGKAIGLGDLFSSGLILKISNYILVLIVWLKMKSKKKGLLTCLIAYVELVEKASLGPLKFPGFQTPLKHPNIQAWRGGVEGNPELRNQPDIVYESQEPYTCQWVKPGFAKWVCVFQKKTPIFNGISIPVSWIPGWRKVQMMIAH